jgi:hypothetical protein
MEFYIMAHYAFLNIDNIVTEVIVGIDETELIEGLTPEEWYGTYDPVNDVFIAPQPYGSWTLDENFDWQPPTPMPVEEGKRYAWFEPNQQWIEVV